MIGLPSRFPAAWTMAVLAVLGSSAVAHSPTPGDEAAHQWWGDYVTCKTWRDIWLEHLPLLRSEPQASASAVSRRSMRRQGRSTRYTKTGTALKDCATNDRAL
ncbi:MAG: hypothetical protein IH897_04065 [Planctomycetes bacterium]|nr:hypothetical protein [Planctomycetota bacterium]